MRADQVGIARRPLCSPLNSVNTTPAAVARDLPNGGGLSVPRPPAAVVQRRHAQLSLNETGMEKRRRRCVVARRHLYVYAGRTSCAAAENER